jgi:ankyrin repeat protein
MVQLIIILFFYAAFSNGAMDLSKNLLDASEKGDYASVRQALVLGVDVNSRRVSTGDTALNLAAKNGHKKVVKKLLSRPKIDVNLKTIAGLTPIMSALKQEHYSVVLLLIDAGADLDTMCNGYDLISIAQEKLRPHLQTQILTREQLQQAEVSANEFIGNYAYLQNQDTATKDASIVGTIVEFLLETIAVNLLDSGSGIFNIICSYLPDNQSFCALPFKYILVGQNKSAVEKLAYTKAAFLLWKNPARLKKIAEVFNQGKATLIRACFNKKTLESIKQLIMYFNNYLICEKDIEKMVAEYSVDDNKKKDLGYILSLVAENKSSDMAILLINMRVDINTHDMYDWTPLMQAVYARLSHVVALLISKKVKINDQAMSGKTALIIAAEESCPDEARLLLAAGADPAMQDKSQDTALSIARRRLDAVAAQIKQTNKIADRAKLKRCEAMIQLLA